MNIVEKAKENWNKNADENNQWKDLDVDEKLQTIIDYEQQTNAVLGEMRLTRNEVDVVRRWCEFIEDSDNAYFNDDEKKLYEKIQLYYLG